MGILNVTPDSFSQDGLWPLIKKNPKKIVALAQRLVNDGADMLDIGGESSRPGSKPISVDEELKRVIPVVKALVKNIKAPISVDTYKPVVAQAALDGGATIINNIMGTHPNKELLKMIKNYQATIILMHIRGTPATMQQHIIYKNLIREIILDLQKSIEICLEIGIKSDRIIIDPGIGFAKTAEQNLKILNHLSELKKLKQPILVGPSRKSFIGKILNKEVHERLIGTIASVCISIIQGAHIVRVHDVAAVKEAVIITEAILNQS